MKIINIIKLSDDPVINQEQQVMEVLFVHKLATLERLFYDILYINPPRDLYQESDLDYIKSDICRILTYYIIQFWNKKVINLYDKLFKCVQCNQWSFFKSFKDGICIICSQEKIREVFSWN